MFGMSIVMHTHSADSLKSLHRFSPAWVNMNFMIPECESSSEAACTLEIRKRHTQNFLLLSHIKNVLLNIYARQRQTRVVFIPPEYFMLLWFYLRIIFAFWGRKNVFEIFHFTTPQRRLYNWEKWDRISLFYAGVKELFSSFHPNFQAVASTEKFMDI
jgi:hypothetical protein